MPGAPELALNRAAEIVNSPLAHEIEQRQGTAFTETDKQEMLDRLVLLVELLPDLFNHRQKQRLWTAAREITADKLARQPDPSWSFAFANSEEVMACLGVDGALECFTRFPGILEQIYLGREARKRHVGAPESALVRRLTYQLLFYALIKLTDEGFEDGDIPPEIFDIFEEIELD